LNVDLDTQFDTTMPNPRTVSNPAISDENGNQYSSVTFHSKPARPSRNSSFGLTRFLAASGAILSHHFALSGLPEPRASIVLIDALSVDALFDE
jgi:hypothetical protein